ncbi:2372_t:CDS:1, partial [Cetraspora pellucida]
MEPSYDAEILNNLLELPEPLSNNIAAILTPNYDYMVSERSLVLNIMNIAAILTPNFDSIASEQLLVSDILELSHYVISEQSSNMMEFSYDTKILESLKLLSNNIATILISNFDCEILERSLISDTMEPLYNAEILEPPELLSNNIADILISDCKVSEQSSILDIIKPLYNANNILKLPEPLPNNIAAVLSSNYDYIVSEFKQLPNYITAEG